MSPGIEGLHHHARSHVAILSILLLEKEDILPDQMASVNRNSELYPNTQEAEVGRSLKFEVNWDGLGFTVVRCLKQFGVHEIFFLKDKKLRR